MAGSSLERGTYGEILGVVFVRGVSARFPSRFCELTNPAQGNSVFDGQAFFNGDDDNLESWFDCFCAEAPAFKIQGSLTGLAEKKWENKQCETDQRPKMLNLCSCWKSKCVSSSTEDVVGFIEDKAASRVGFVAGQVGLLFTWLIILRIVGGFSKVHLVRDWCVIWNLGNRGFTHYGCLHQVEVFARFCGLLVIQVNVNVVHGVRLYNLKHNFAWNFSSIYTIVILFSDHLQGLAILYNMRRKKIYCNCMWKGDIDFR